MKLIPKPETVVTLLVTFPDVRAAGRSAQRLTAERLLPRCVELLDGATLEALRQAGNPLDPRAGALLLEVSQVEQAVEALFRGVIALGGSLSAEHGIGVLRAPYLPLEQSSRLIALQQGLKKVFDPRGLLNPGKIFPTAGPTATQTF